MHTYWLEVGQHIEDNQVVQEVKKGRNGPFHGITKILPGKTSRGMIQTTLWNENKLRGKTFFLFSFSTSLFQTLLNRYHCCVLKNTAGLQKASGTTGL